ncbi:hypothetical protein [Tellurirhabdus rosea]|uniref:hypothetical protein n=1 Tax=Tellurirhabdus rosea TaxID=2674997 RepID=UPI00225A41E4|nr:hypothetical protein [Tellurirhabdus rosea]
MDVRQLRAIGFFYRQLCPVTLPVSILLWSLGRSRVESPDSYQFFLTAFVWLRILLQLIIYYLHRLLNGNHLTFYQNLGLSEGKLYLSASLTDALVCLLLIHFTGY